MCRFVVVATIVLFSVGGDDACACMLLRPMFDAYVCYTFNVHLAFLLSQLPQSTQQQKIQNPDSFRLTDSFGSVRSMNQTKSGTHKRIFGYCYYGCYSYSLHWWLLL